MESINPQNVSYSKEQDIAFEQKQPKPAKKEKPIMLQVFKEVFLGFFVGIGKGVFNFFKRYFVLVWNCAKFLWKPNADEHTSANERTINNAKETFELILILTTITIFLVKQDVIVSDEMLKELYGNDLWQYGIEFLWFIYYVIAFFFVLTVLILLGRLLRVIFKPIESRDVTDKVFINLNNIFFIITIIYSFIRKFDPYNTTDLVNIDAYWYEVWFFSYGVPLIVIVFLFFIRLVMINKLTIGRAFAYCIVAPLVTVLLLAVCGLFFTAFFASI